jgi:hypothetical protein
MRLKKAEGLRRGDCMRDIAIVTGVLVLKPIGEIDEEKIADDAIIKLVENFNKNESGE